MRSFHYSRDGSYDCSHFADEDLGATSFGFPSQGGGCSAERQSQEGTQAIGPWSSHLDYHTLRPLCAGPAGTEDMPGCLSYCSPAHKGLGCLAHKTGAA